MLRDVVSALRELVSGGSAGPPEAGEGSDRSETTGTTPLADGGEKGESPSERDVLEEFLEDEEMSLEKVLVTTRRQPAEFLVELVRHEDGRMWQSEIVDLTGWSESSVSRRLCQLETDDRLQRRQIGRQKLVFLPGSAPEVETTSGSSARRQRRSGA